MGRSITSRLEPMKPSNGRAQGVANRAASRVATGLAGFVATAAATTFVTAAFGLAGSFLCVGTAHAQVSTATSDGTPQIDASIAQKDWTNALAQVDERLKTNPRDVQAKFKRATILARLNRDDEAIAAFTELTQAYPELPEPYNNLAALYAKHGRYEDARAALEVAIKANPSYALAYDNLGDLYLRLASESYKRAQSLGSKSALSRQRVADIQKIIAPPVQKKRIVPSSEYGTPGASGTGTVPAMTLPSPYTPFGGPTGPFPTSPYVAPSAQP
ncbi:tetratricopeptide repeat protein [Caballeronia sp. LZ024]|nr:MULTISPECIES: tetratricopeptide repeat protein [unclassified Caballeronia]MDR5750375.1 tetratricopeptide repeat protein [Caballeronia sp. LZ024]MDR5842592.1 tetratricopeptide repeat protein [Caballeronia sp. LZ031]